MNHNARIYQLFKNATSNSPIPGCYYSHEHYDIKKKKRKFKDKKLVDDEKHLHKKVFDYKRKNRKNISWLGLSDFFIFNLMILQPQ